MKKLLLCLGIALLTLSVSAQRLLSWTPEFPTDGGNITFTIDCTKGNQGLLNYQGGASADVYVHIGVNTNLSTNPSDWKYVKFANFNAATPEAKATVLGNNKYSFTITNIRAFFGVPAGETINKINCIFRSGNGSLKQVNSDGSDMYIPMYTAGQFATRFNLPPSEPRFIPFVEPINVSVGGTVTTQAVSSAPSNMTLKLNGNTVASAASTTVINSVITIPTNCDQKITVEANNGTVTVKDSIQFTIPQATVVAPLPSGAIEGINYNPNNTAATFVLFAPNKTSVSMIGDFNNWLPNCASSMNKTADGNYWWTTLTGLIPGQEYRFQYLVDNNIRIPDPYCQKILDPFNDQFINTTTYPNLIPYPVGLTSDLVGVFQTAEPQYTWTTTNYIKPDKRNLMIYELLIRDFTAEHSYQSLMDSIQYFKNLGINAIELMPVNEFDGNESWGYNPAFFFAPDKYYGTKNKLKQFIDLCHANGIAVLLDVVYNHCTGAAPQAKMYWNSATNQPTADNPWLNVTAPHPYSVFNDFNHTKEATKYLVNRSIKFWLDEYRIDGYRFDLGKGFTQTVTNTSTVENFDASRVAILNNYYDSTVLNHPTAYMILEFLAGNSPSSEEQAYANKGWMLWGNINTRYNQNTMAYASNSNLSSVVYNSSERAFSNPALVGYMESHDEERLMFRNITNGNSNANYNTRNINTALRQAEAAASVFFTIPGPKMVWQFGERGYDVSLFFGGSNVANKPPRWEYMLVPERRRLYDSYKKMMDLRLQNPAIFNNTTFTYDLNDGGGLFRRFQIADPAASGQKVTVIANLDLVPQTRTITFQSAGDWTNYLTNGTGTGINGATGSTFTLTNTSQSIVLQPGEYHIYLSAAPCATTAPTVTSPIAYCQNATATALTATGTSLLWYTVASGGTGVATAPLPSTSTAGTVSYYVSQKLNGCEGPRAVINVIVNATPAAPTVNATIALCQGVASVPLTATGTNLLWYTTSTGGTGLTTAPTPATTATGTVNYYVSQTINNCESPRALISVTTSAVPTAPTVTSSINYCQNATATALTATGANLLWYTSATGGTGNATAPIPSTTTVGTINYFVTQTNNGCESPRAQISVITSAVPLAPVVSTPVTYCQNATATALTASGTNLLWYTTASGGTGSSTAPIPSTTTIGSTIFYVSQSSNGCESPRASITVSITATTAAPTVVSPVNYCQNATATVLTATGTSLLWYTSATGGTGSSTAPLPSTTTVGSTNYYVSQTQSCGESPRALITVNVNAIPTAPVVTSTVTYCQNVTSTALTATGAGLLWYTTASGGTGTSTAPTPSTITVGTTVFYVSQNINGCESPRAMISVTVNASPNAPTVSTPITYCQGLTAAPLTATGTGLLWYQTATGGTGFSTAPTPSTTSVGSTSYYVSQSANGCESPRATITVNITAATTAPAVVSPITYCQGSTATALTATGTNLNWYTVATGGTGTTVSPTPSTATAGSTTFYVSQTGTCGEGPRAAIVVTINATPAAVNQLTSTNITLTSATLAWVGQAGNFYNVEYKATSSSSWIVAATGITQNSFVLNNLTAATSYDWRVSTNCINVPSNNFAQANFTTKDAITTNLIVAQGIGINLSPNPATNATKLTYSLTQSGQVGIVIYNSAGQQIRNLYSGNRPAGVYSLDFSNQLDNLAAGTYYLRVSQGSNSNTIPFIKL
jgi:glycosidase